MPSSARKDEGTETVVNDIDFETLGHLLEVLLFLLQIGTKMLI